MPKSKSTLIESTRDAAFEAALDGGFSPKAAVILAEEGDTYLPVEGKVFPMSFTKGPCGICSEPAASARVVIHLTVSCWMRVCHSCQQGRIVAFDGSTKPLAVVAEEHMASTMSTGAPRRAAFEASRRHVLRRAVYFG